MKTLLKKQEEQSKFKITYEYSYPYAEEDIRVAYVVAQDIGEAWDKVCEIMDGEYESACLKKIEVLDRECLIIN